MWTRGEPFIYQGTCYPSFTDYCKKTGACRFSIMRLKQTMELSLEDAVSYWWRTNAAIAQREKRTRREIAAPKKMAAIYGISADRIRKDDDIKIREIIKERIRDGSVIPTMLIPNRNNHWEPCDEIPFRSRHPYYDPIFYRDDEENYKVEFHVLEGIPVEIIFQSPKYWFVSVGPLPHDKRILQEQIDRSWLWNIIQREDGYYMQHVNVESDVRSLYNVYAIVNSMIRAYQKCLGEILPEEI